VSALADVTRANAALAAIETAVDDATAEQHLADARRYGAGINQCRRAWAARVNRQHMAGHYRPPAPRQPDERVTRCVTGKLRYPSQDRAGKALNELLRLRAVRGQTEVFEQRAYPCGRCDGWHLTSKATADEDVA
jgi:hypothetical protein